MRILGIPVYFVASLLEMSRWGETDAELLKSKINSIFDDGGCINMLPEYYRYKVIGCTSDGASVNFGHKSGLLGDLKKHTPG